MGFSGIWGIDHFYPFVLWTRPGLSQTCGNWEFYKMWFQAIEFGLASHDSQAVVSRLVQALGAALGMGAVPLTELMQGTDLWLWKRMET